jgi:hypothetical protein
MTTAPLNFQNEFKEQVIKVISTADQHRVFIMEANAARKQVIRSGTGYEAKDVHKYLRDRIADKKTSSPKLKSW